MRYFYEEQQRRLEAMGEEGVSLEELLNEFNDMIAPAQPSRFRLAELQRCGLAHNVLSALTNVRKYVAWRASRARRARGARPTCATRATGTSSPIGSTADWWTPRRRRAAPPATRPAAAATPKRYSAGARKS